MRIKKLKIPIYDYRLTLIESSNPEKVEKYFRNIEFKFIKRELYAHAIDHIRFEKGERWICAYLVFNRKNKWQKMSHSTIAHECKHIADDIFNQIGVKHFDDEPHNYLLHYLVKAVNNFFEIKDEIR